MKGADQNNGLQVRLQMWQVLSEMIRTYNKGTWLLKLYLTYPYHDPSNYFHFNKLGEKNHRGVLHVNVGSGPKEKSLDHSLCEVGIIPNIQNKVSMVLTHGTFWHYASYHKPDMRVRQEDPEMKEAYI